MAMTTPQTYGAPAAKKPKLEHDASTPSTPQPLTSTTPAPTATTATATTTTTSSSSTATTTTQPPYSTAPQWSTRMRKNHVSLLPAGPPVLI